jgi:polyisoprenoid-binding protein YceI
LPEINQTNSGNSLTTPEVSTASDVNYVIDARVSRFTVRVSASGMLSAFGHSPTIAIRDFAGEARLNPNALESARLHLTVKAASLQVTDNISDKDRREIEREMQENVLEIARHPEIVYECSRVTGSNALNGQTAITLNGNLTLHGQTRPQAIPVGIAISGDMLRAYGEFSLRQSDYNIKLVSAIGGGLKVKDEVRFFFDIVARKQE